MAAAREFDVVVFGATGFTGIVCVSYQIYVSAVMHISVYVCVCTSA